MSIGLFTSFSPYLIVVATYALLLLNFSFDGSNQIDHSTKYTDYEFSKKISLPTIRHSQTYYFRDRYFPLEKISDWYYEKYFIPTKKLFHIDWTINTYDLYIPILGQFPNPPPNLSLLSY